MPCWCFFANLLREHSLFCHLVSHRGPGHSYCAALGEDACDGRDKARRHRRSRAGHQNRVAMKSQRVRDPDPCFIHTTSEGSGRESGIFVWMYPEQTWYLSLAKEV